jgi:transglutaminase-like putative cysteine protease
MLLRIEHETRLIYTSHVGESVIEMRTAPPSTEDQTVLGYRLKVTPAAPITSFRDGFGNRVELFNMLAPHREISVSATSFVRVHRRIVLERMANIPWPPELPTAIEALDFLAPSPLIQPTPLVEQFVTDLPPLGGSLADVVRTIKEAVRQRMRYEKKVTTANTAVHEALKLGCGVCQDYAHLFIAACRGLGLPARYVSGYINQPGEIATHAWCQVWGGKNIGWMDVDPTHNVMADQDHVVTAHGRDFSDVPPNRGVWKGLAEEEISVSVSVTPVERVPADFVELGAQAAWSSTSYTQRQTNRRLNQQALIRGFRQQQSQQQQ